MRLMHRIIMVFAVIAGLVCFSWTTAFALTRKTATLKPIRRVSTTRASPTPALSDVDDTTPVKTTLAPRGKSAPPAKPTKTADSKKDDGIAHFEIQEFRFGKHAKQGYERLVLQLRTSKKGIRLPSVKTSMNPASQMASVFVQNAELVGAIPESSINTYFRGRSRLLTALTIDNSSTSSLTIRVDLKDKGTTVDSLWLDNPARLVIDVFGNVSARASGVALADQKSSGKSTAKQSKHSVRTSDYICFPYTAQVTAALSTEQVGRSAPRYQIELEAPTLQDVETKPDDAVFCYPKASQITAKVEMRKGTPEIVVPPPPPSVSPTTASTPVETPVPKAETDSKQAVPPGAPPLLEQPTAAATPENPLPPNREVTTTEPKEAVKPQVITEPKSDAKPVVPAHDDF